MDDSKQPIKPGAAAKTVREIAAAADFRNASRDETTKGLDLLEKRFRRGDASLKLEKMKQRRLSNPPRPTTASVRNASADDED